MCCLAADYCLSNALCCNGFGNNFLTSKGCTDPNRGSSCGNICKGRGLAHQGSSPSVTRADCISAVGFGQSLFPCPNTESNNGIVSLCLWSGHHCLQRLRQCDIDSGWNNCLETRSDCGDHSGTHFVACKLIHIRISLHNTNSKTVCSTLYDNSTTPKRFEVLPNSFRACPWYWNTV
jgi:hypothetical protein